MINTFLKIYKNNEQRNTLMDYYCYMRLNNILPSDFSLHNASIVSTSYYNMIIDGIRDIIHLPGFPSITNEKLYNNMLTKVESLAEIQYPTFNWKNIWGNYMNLFIYSYDKEIIYKHLNMCLATNQRLFSMNLINSSSCNKCITHREQTPLHMLYECPYIKDLFTWLLQVLYLRADFRPSSNIKCIYFDNRFSTSEQKNICNLFISSYILIVWKTRKENLRVAILKKMIVEKVIETIYVIDHIPNKDKEKLFGTYLDRINAQELANI